MPQTAETLRGWYASRRQRARVDVRFWSELAGAPLFAGRSIALVGNAGYLKDRRQGDAIDDSDLVIRMNNFRVTGYEHAVGARCDLLLTNFFTDIDFDHPDLRQPSILLSSSPNNFVKLPESGVHIRHGQLITAGMRRLKRRRVYVPSLSWFERYIALLGRYPSTGACGILFILDHLLKHCGEIFLTGFSFFSCESHYFSKARVDPATNHDAQAERLLLTGRLLPLVQSERVRVDPVMAALLNKADSDQARAA